MSRASSSIYCPFVRQRQPGNPPEGGKSSSLRLLYPRPLSSTFARDSSSGEEEEEKNHRVKFLKERLRGNNHANEERKRRSTKVNGDRGRKGASVRARRSKEVRISTVAVFCRARRVTDEQRTTRLARIPREHAGGRSLSRPRSVHEQPGRRSIGGRSSIDENEFLYRRALVARPRRRSCVCEPPGDYGNPLTNRRRSFELFACVEGGRKAGAAARGNSFVGFCSGLLERAESGAEPARRNRRFLSFSVSVSFSSKSLCGCPRSVWLVRFRLGRRGTTQGSVTPRQPPITR